MEKKNIFKLALYGGCALFFVTFVCGVANLFSVMSARGFDLTEYWALIVFGVGISLIAAVYSLINGLVIAIGFFRKRRLDAKVDKSPINHALSADFKNSTVYEDGSPYKDAQTDNSTQISVEEGEVVYAPKTADVVFAEDRQADTQSLSQKKQKKKRRMTFAERRRQKLLKEEEPKRKNGITGFVVIAIITIGCLYYTFWSIAPHKLCYHTYTYNQAENNSLPEQGEIKTYRFYQDYLGKPYFVYLDNDREFKVSLVSSKRGKDDVGEYILYHFATEEEYAKVLDCALDKFTYLTVELDAYYYVADAHLVINHRAIRTRTGVETVYEHSGKIYSYKNLNK